jgi:hypothetical protein
MRSILFNVKPEVTSAGQERLFNRLKAIPGIHRTSCLHAKARDAALRRMCFAEVKEEADIQALLTQIRALPEVEEAGLPAQRGLS